MRLSRGALDLTNGQRYSLDGSEIPFPDLDSIVALLPSYAQGDDAGAMRDALLNTIRLLANKIWADTGLALNAFVSPRYANGTMLDVWGVIRQMPRRVGEEFGAYRSRLLAAGNGVTPTAIKAAVQDAATEFNARVAFQEPANDGIYFAGDDLTAQSWSSYWQDYTQIYWNTDPLSPGSTDGGFWPPDVAGAQFWIAMQLGAGSDALTPRWSNDAGSDADSPQGYFADDAVDFGYWGFIGDPLEDRIVAEANARKAFGIAWLLIEHPYLNGAV